MALTAPPFWVCFAAASAWRARHAERGPFRERAGVRSGRRAGVAPPISFESQDLATIEGLVAAGFGVAIVPEPFAGQCGTTGIPIRAEGAHRTIGLTWRADRALSAPASRLRDVVRQRSV